MFTRLKIPVVEKFRGRTDIPGDFGGHRIDAEDVKPGEYVVADRANTITITKGGRALLRWPA